jgi:IclR family transcriptional regulator, acetate operon repressor
MHTTPDFDAAIERGTDDKLVGSDRVLAVLLELGRHPDGIGLDEMARAVRSPKPTVHRALASLRRANLAAQDAPGHYMLGDELLRMAFTNHESRPEHRRVQPILERLTARHGETSHYAVLDGDSIVYRAKVDPTVGAMRLTSTVGGRNPAHSTAVGKLLLSYRLLDERAVAEWVGDRELDARTAKTMVTPSDLHEELCRIRERGYSVDDRENEPDVNCLAVPVFFGSPAMPTGGISISAIAHRTPVHSLIEDLPAIRSIVDGRADALTA